MATIKETDGIYRVQPDSVEDVQKVTITREEARGYFDGEGLGEAFEAALDLAQAEAEGQQAVVILVVAQEPTAA